MVPGSSEQTPAFASMLRCTLILLTALLFTIGSHWQSKRYVAHRWVQTSAVILNTFVVSVHDDWLLFDPYPSRHRRRNSAKNQGDYALTTVHAIVGSVGMVLGVFIVLRANKLVPKALPF